LFFSQKEAIFVSVNCNWWWKMDILW